MNAAIVGKNERAKDELGIQAFFAFLFCLIGIFIPESSWVTSVVISISTIIMLHRFYLLCQISEKARKFFGMMLIVVGFVVAASSTYFFWQVYDAPNEALAAVSWLRMIVFGIASCGLGLYLYNKKGG